LEEFRPTFLSQEWFLYIIPGLSNETLKSLIGDKTVRNKILRLGKDLAERLEEDIVLKKRKKRF